MLRFVLPGIIALATAASTLGPAAHARADTSDGEDDLGITLVEMFAAMSDTLALHQDQVADESYLGSRGAISRLQRATVRVPAVTLRQGASPLVEGWILFRDDD